MSKQRTLEQTVAIREHRVARQRPRRDGRPRYDPEVILLDPRDFKRHAAADNAWRRLPPVLRRRLTDR